MAKGLAWYHKNKGFVGVLTILIVSAITLAIVVTGATLAADEDIFNSLAIQQQNVLLLADGCADEAQYRLKLSSSYTGGTVAYSSATCTVTVTGSGSTRTIVSTVTVNNVTRTVTVAVNLLNNTAGNANEVNESSWTES